MRILGISCFYHDAAAALDRRRPADRGGRRGALQPQETRLGLSAAGHPVLPRDRPASRSRDLDYVVFYEKPFVKFERILTTALQVVPKSWKVFGDAMTTWLLDKLWVKNLIRQELGVPADRILFSEHHLSHAASTFLCSPFEEAAILTVDGVGEWATRDDRTRQAAPRSSCCARSAFPHSVGLLYSAFTAFLGFEVNEGEYKVMGMAPYGDAALRRQGLQALSTSTRDGSFWLDMDYFCFHHSSTRTYNSKFTDSVRRAARSVVALLHRAAPAIRRTSSRQAVRTSASWRREPVLRRRRRQHPAGAPRRSCSAMVRALHRGDRARTRSAWPAAWR